MLVWIIENTVLALTLAVLVSAITRVVKSRPAMAHAMWLAVLVVLLLPPMPSLLPICARDCLSGARVATQSWLAPQHGAGDGTEVFTAEKSPAGTFAGFDGELSALLEEPDTVAASSLPITATGPTSTPAGRGPLEVFLLLSWLIGSIVMLVCHGKRIVRFQRCLSQALPGTVSLKTVVQRLARRTGVRSPRVLRLGGLSSPIIWAAPRPTLLWPAGMNEDRMGAPGMIAHELAHLRRRDHFVAWLELGGMILLWWNPLFWIVRREIRRHAEEACDAWVAHALPEERRPYAEALIDLAQNSPTTLFPTPALGLWNDKRAVFERRLKVIMSHKSTHRVPALMWVAMFIVAAFILPTSSTAHQPTGFEVSTGGAGSPSISTAVRLRMEIGRAEELQSGKDWAQAENAWRKVVEIDPTNGDAWRWIGYDLLAQGRPAEAIKPLTKQVKLGNKPGIGLYNLACAHALTGESERAIKFLQNSSAAGYNEREAIEKDADLESLHQHPGFQKYLQTIDKIVALEKNAKEAWKNKEKKEAEALYTQLVDMVPTIGTAWHVLGFCAVERGDLAAARVAFQKQVNCGYSVANGHYNLACTESLAGHVDRALDHLETAISEGFSDFDRFQEDPDLEAVCSSQGFDALVKRATMRKKSAKMAKVAYNKKDWGTMVTACAKLLKVSPDHPQAHGWQGKALFHEGEHDGALAAYQRQLDRGKNIGESFYYIGYINALRDNTDTALICMEHAVDCGYTKLVNLAGTNALTALEALPRFVKLLDRAHDMQMREKKKDKKKAEKAQWKKDEKKKKKQAEDVYTGSKEGEGEPQQ